jgi:hypothetical protein
MSLEQGLIERFTKDVTSLIEGGTDVLVAINETAKTVVSEAADFGEDLTLAAAGVVAGAISVAGQVAVTFEDAAAAAANGAVDAAADVSTNAAGRVRDAIVGTVKGVKVIVTTVVD